MGAIIGALRVRDREVPPSIREPLEALQEMGALRQALSRRPARQAALARATKALAAWSHDGGRRGRSVQPRGATR